MRTGLRLGAALLSALGVIWLSTGGGYALDEAVLEELTREASHILVGEIVDVTEAGGEGGAFTEVSFRVAYALKGRVESEELRIRIEGWPPEEEQPGLVAGEKRVVFLALTEAGQFELCGGYLGIVEASDTVLAQVRGLLEEPDPPDDLLRSVRLEVTTDKDHYEEGENVQITISACNQGNSEVTLVFRSGLRMDYLMDNAYQWSRGRAFTQAVESVAVAPGECYTQDFVHTPEQMRLCAGVHTVVGLVAGYDLRASARFTVGELGRIEGTVMDEGGNPVASARVTAYRVEPADSTLWYNDPDSPDRYSEEDACYWAPVSYTACTDEQGAFVIGNIVPGITLQVVAAKCGYERASRVLGTHSGVMTVELVLARIRIGQISGRVVDEEGNGVPQAIVTPWPWGFCPEYDQPVFSDEAGNRYAAGSTSAGTCGDACCGSDEACSGEYPGCEALTNYVLTGEDGAFWIGGLRLGTTVELTVFKDGYETGHESVPVNEDTVHVTIVLRRILLGKIVGHVFDEEENPVEGAVVTAWCYADWPDPIWREISSDQEGAGSAPGADGTEVAGADSAYGYDDPTIMPPDEPYSRLAVTDENGAFVLEEMRRGVVIQLTVSKPGYETARREVMMDAEVVEVAIELKQIRMGRIEGLVLDEDGVGVSEALVVVYPVSWHPWLIKEIWYRAQEEFETIVPRMLELADEGDVPPVAPERSFDAQYDNLDEWTQRVRYTWTDSGGAFVVDQLPLGNTFGLAALKRGYYCAHQIVEMDSSVVTVELILRAILTTVVEGRVVDEYGTGIPEARVEAYLTEFSAVGADSLILPMPYARYASSTDSTGRFALEGVPVGQTIWITAQKEAYEPARKRVEVSEETPPIMLVLVGVDQTYRNLRSVVREQVRYELGTDTFRYLSGDTVRVQYRLVNLGEEAVGFEFSSDQQVGIVLISQEGEEVWRWSEEPDYAGASAGSLVLEPGAPIAYHALLDTDKLDGATGYFELRGFLGEPYRGQSEVGLKLQVLGPLSQSAVVEGTVTEDVGMLDVWIPIPGATVVARPACLALAVDEQGIRSDCWPDTETRKWVATTDEHGRFVLRGLEASSTYEITAYKQGYESESKLVHTTYDTVRVDFSLREIEVDQRYNNVSYFIAHNLRFELATDRRFYGNQDVVHMRYRLTNVGATPVSVVFAGGQTHHFLVSSEEGLVWDSGEDAATVEATTRRSLEPRESLDFEETLDLSQYQPLKGRLTVTGWLELSQIADADGTSLDIRPEETKISVDILVGEEWDVVRVFADESPCAGSAEEDWESRGKVVVDARHTLGAYIEFTTLGTAFDETLELNQADTNHFADLAGCEFVKLVDFGPDPALSAVIESAYIEVSYDPDRLDAIGASASDLGLFYWTESGNPGEWEEAQSVVDSVHNVVSGDVPPLVPVAVFAKLAQPADVEGDQDPQTPTTFSLSQNFPNPFNVFTTVRFTIAPGTEMPARCELSIYNARGQKVRTLVSGVLDAGQYQIAWDGRSDDGKAVSSGLYFCRLSAPGYVEVQKMALVK